MKKYSQYIYTLLLGALLIFGGCDEEKYELGTLTTPSNVGLSYVIVGQDDENPNGDGSGMVTFTASADSQITFNYLFGDGTDSEISPDGSMEHQFTKTGVNTYNVTVMAVGAGGVASSKSLQVAVLSTFSDEEALILLGGNTGESKIWYWAADQPGNIGLGPNDKKYPGNEHTFDFWFHSDPWHSDKLCMYDAEFVFTNTGDVLTFEQTAGSAYIPGDVAASLGVAGDICHGEDVVPSLYGVKNVTFAPASSLATEDGEYRGTSMTFSDGGFMCWYVKQSTFEIMDVTENLLKIRIEEPGSNRAWYCIYTIEKPVQP